MAHQHNTWNNGRNLYNNDEPTTINDLIGIMGRMAGVMEQKVNMNREQQANAVRRTEQPRQRDTLDDFLRKNPSNFNGSPNLGVVTA